MANFSALKTAIQNAIKQNGNEEITGDVLQQILLSIVSTMGDGAINTIEQNLSNETTTRQGADTQLQNAINAIKANIDNGYVYAGIATPSTVPVSGKVFYIATAAGTYTNFGRQVLTQGINILRFNGSAWSHQQLIGIDDVPTPASNSLVKSGGVQNELALGAVYDVSAKNPTAGPNNDGKWESLSALFSDANLNTLIPTAYRKGGMSIKFVQSFDNKYIQARCISDEFTTTVANWQCVSEEIIAGSQNIAQSSGVANIVALNNGIHYDKSDASIVGSFPTCILDYKLWFKSDSVTGNVGVASFYYADGYAFVLNLKKEDGSNLGTVLLYSGEEQDKHGIETLELESRLYIIVLTIDWDLYSVGMSEKSTPKILLNYETVNDVSYKVYKDAKKAYDGLGNVINDSFSFLKPNGSFLFKKVSLLAGHTYKLSIDGINSQGVNAVFIRENYNSVTNTIVTKSVVNGETVEQEFSVDSDAIDYDLGGWYSETSSVNTNIEIGVTLKDLTAEKNKAAIAALSNKTDFVEKDLRLKNKVTPYLGAQNGASVVDGNKIVIPTGSTGLNSTVSVNTTSINVGVRTCSAIHIKLLSGTWDLWTNYGGTPITVSTTEKIFFNYADRDSAGDSGTLLNYIQRNSTSYSGEASIQCLHAYRWEYSLVDFASNQDRYIAFLSELFGSKSVVDKLVDSAVTGVRLNLFDKSAATVNKYIDYTNGKEITLQNYYASDWIKVDPGEKYTLSNTIGANLQQGAFYSSKAVSGYVSGFLNGAGTAGKVTLTVPATANYIRFTIPPAQIDNTQFEKGEQQSEYHAYKDIVIQKGSYNIKELSDLILNNPIELYVTKNGANGSFTTIRAAIEEALNYNQTQKVIIHVGVGTYELTDEYTDEEFINDATFFGWSIPYNVKLIGDEPGVVLSGNLSNELAGNTARATAAGANVGDLVATIDLSLSCDLENITVLSYNTRYCVHDDRAGSTNDVKRVVKNCNFYKRASNYGKNAAYGAGCRAGADWIFENCLFYSEKGIGFSVHDNKGFTKPAKMTFKSCQFNGHYGTEQMRGCDVSLVSMAHNNDNVNNPIDNGTKKNEAYFENCVFKGTGLYLRDMDTTYVPVGFGLDWNVTGVNNTGGIYIYTALDIATEKYYTYFYDEDFRRFTRDSNVVYGVPVVFNHDYDENVVKASSQQWQDITGIVVAVLDNYGSDKNVIVKEKGYIDGALIGLSSVSIGDKYKVEDGTFVTTTGDDWYLIGTINNFLKIRTK